MLALQPRAHFLISVCLYFPICKIGAIIVPIYWVCTCNVHSMMSGTLVSIQMLTVAATDIMVVVMIIIVTLSCTVYVFLDVSFAFPLTEQFLYPGTVLRPS